MKNVHRQALHVTCRNLATQYQLIIKSILITKYLQHQSALRRISVQFTSQHECSTITVQYSPNNNVYHPRFKEPETLYWRSMSFIVEHKRHLFKYQHRRTTSNQWAKDTRPQYRLARWRCSDGRTGHQSRVMIMYCCCIKNN